ncbi:MAG: Isoquinoline 1-oxidoreductase subunit [Archangium sp.]|nr:Isoquinoline 1-oxidoreductase subunit [Archangium sp.]
MAIFHHERLTVAVLGTRGAVGAPSEVEALNVLWPRSMTRVTMVMVAVFSGACSVRVAPAVSLPPVVEVPVPGSVLRPVSAFDEVAGDAARSKALFTEMHRVFSHPRCANCHPADDSPRQGMDSHRHDPPVTRGPDDHGVVGMECTTCHQDANVALTRVPGAPKWHVAPIEMAWVGKSAGSICRQIKDRARNGGKSLEEIHEHLAHDALVAWGWAPGADREPAPGRQAQLGELTEAWIRTGAHCPEESSQ